MEKKRKEAVYTDQESIELHRLYKYIRKNILLYPENKPMTKFIVLRIKELRTGNYMNMKETEHLSLGGYTYPEIMIAFIFCKVEILEAFVGKTFKNDNYKMAYALAIVKSKINGILSEIEREKEEKEKAKITDISHLTDGYDCNEYKPKTKINEKLKDLW